MLCLFLCLFARAELPSPGTPDTSYMEVVSPRIRAAQKMCCGMCCGKFRFLPQTCLKQSHASAFRTTPNDSLSVPNLTCRVSRTLKPLMPQLVSGVLLYQAFSWNTNKSTLVLVECVGGYKGVGNSFRGHSPTRKSGTSDQPLRGRGFRAGIHYS